MTQSYYIRSRGQVLGPFSQDELQTLVRRGQFGRLHEVSEDGLLWRTAASLPHLLAVADNLPQRNMQPANKNISAPDGLSPQAMAPVSESQPAGSTRPDVTASPAQPSAAKWHYDNFGQPAGPVEWARLQHLIRSGQLPPDTLVWSDGMPDWMPARNFPGLVSAASPAAAPVDLGTTDKANVGEPRSVSGLAVTSLIMGILGLIFSPLLVGFLMCILASVFGGAALYGIQASHGRKVGRGMASAGLVTGIVGMSFSIVVLLYFLVVLDRAPRSLWKALLE